MIFQEFYLDVRYGDRLATTNAHTRLQSSVTAVVLTRVGRKTSTMLELEKEDSR